MNGLTTLNLLALASSTGGAPALDLMVASILTLEEDALLVVVFDDLPFKDLLGHPLEDLLGWPRLASGISSSEESSKEANILVFFG